MKLSDSEIRERLSKLGNGWSLNDNAIVKRYTFGGFPEAVAFVDRLVPIAESADHHPDISISYKRVTLSYSTHDEGGLTVKDFEGAAAADGAANATA
jgi:4a-hydroxytetrahydrobiopterin dehydratase